MLTDRDAIGRLAKMHLEARGIAWTDRPASPHGLAIGIGDTHVAFSAAEMAAGLSGDQIKRRVEAACRVAAC